MAAAARIAAADTPEALQLALDYQLLGPQTNCILLRERADADKVSEETELHRISSMLAAGWGATSTLLRSRTISQASQYAPHVWRSVQPMACCMTDLDDDLPHGRTGGLADDGGLVSLQAMAAAVVEHLARGAVLQGLAAQGSTMTLHPDARLALDSALALGLTADEAWLLLAHWVNTYAGGATNLVAAATVQPYLDGLDEGRIEQCMELFCSLLGGHASDTRTASRAQRLQSALARSSK